jgi:hypothetical protein
MNLTAEQIDELFERSKDDRAMIVGSEVRQLAAMAKRTRAAEAALELLARYPSKPCEELGVATMRQIARDALKNAATQVKGDQPLGQTNPSLNNTPAVAAPERCPKCGYSYEDCQTHLDHSLCGEPTPRRGSRS